MLARFEIASCPLKQEPLNGAYVGLSKRAEINPIRTIFFCLFIQFNSTTSLEINVREQYTQEGVTRSS